MNRKIEVKKEGLWVETEFTELKIGDTFRAFDPTSNGKFELVTYKNGQSEYTVIEEPTFHLYNDTKIWGVKIKETL